MYLVRIALHDVRSIKDLSLDFRTAEGDARRWTLLLGENGCGKSSILRAIALLLAGSEALPELLGDPDAWIRHGAESCKIEGTLVTAKGEIREISLSIRRGDGIRQIFTNNLASLEALDNAIYKADRNYFVLGYGVSRRPPALKNRSSFPDERSRVPRAQGVMTLFSSDANLVSLEQWVMDLDYRGGIDSLRAVSDALDKLLPGMTFSHIDRKSRQIIFKTVDGEIPLSQLSDGYQNMAAWCGDLLYRITETFPDRKDPLSTRGVLLIDELDLHLHPTWRRNLVDFLSTLLPNFQFITTTHSALTAQQSGEHELYVIVRDQLSQSPTLVPFVGEPRKMMLHQLLMSPMFGLASLDSVEVENARAIVRKLSTQDTLTAAEKRTLKAMQAVLSDAPRWDIVPQYAKEQASLVKSLKRSLNPSNKNIKISPVKLKGMTKRLESDQ